MNNNNKSTILEMVELNEKFIVGGLPIYNLMVGDIIGFIVNGSRQYNIKIGEYKLLLSETKRLEKEYKQTKNPEIYKKLVSNVKQLKKVIKFISKHADDPSYTKKGEELLNKLNKNLNESVDILNEKAFNNYDWGAGTKGDISTALFTGTYANIVNLIYRLRTKVPFSIGKVEELQNKIKRLEQEYKIDKDPKKLKQINKYKLDVIKYARLIVNKSNDLKIKKEFSDIINKQK